MLPIQLSGHGVEITPALNEFVHKKFQRLEKHAGHITHIHLFFNINKDSQAAEVTVHIPGHEISARAESEDMYKTIGLLVDKLVRQLDKYKSKIDKKHERISITE